MFEKYLQETYPKFRLVSKYTNGKTKISIKCIDCNTSWDIIPNNFKNRGDKTYCPKCTPKQAHNRKNSSTFVQEVADKYPHLAVIGSYTTARVPVLVSCTKGHSWTVDPSHLLNKGVGSTCRECAGLPAWGTKPVEFFEKEMQNKFPHLITLETYSSARNHILVKDLNCGHSWNIEPNALLSSNIGSVCRICNPIYSRGEKSLTEFIKSQYSGWLVENDKTILQGKELDIVLPDIGIAFEFNGLYWHQENKLGRTYHRDKTEATEDFGYRLIHINEDEWFNKQDIVKSKIKNILGLSNKIYARKCAVGEINYPKLFLQGNHLQGAGSPTSKNFGLFLGEELVSVMTFSVPRFTTQYDWELVRFCSKKDFTVVGGASKLFRYAKKRLEGSIISYADRRWSSGSLYRTLKFVFSHNSDPNYRYYKGLNSLSRYQCQKHKLQELFPEIYKDGLSESEIMTLAGYFKVYDVGSSVWIFK